MVEILVIIIVGLIYYELKDLRHNFKDRSRKWKQIDKKNVLLKKE